MLAAALNGEEGIAQMKRKMDEDERERVMRTLEDPYLVGEEAAEKNRQERLRRERMGGEYWRRKIGGGIGCWLK